MAHRFNPDRLHRLNDPEREKMLDPDLLWEGFGAESPGSVDLAYLIDVYHELEDAPRMLGELLRLLKPGAPLAVVDCKKDPMPHGPPVARRVEEEAIKRQMERAGLAGVAEPASLPFHAFLTGHKEPAGR
jgi:hypothetical protein